MLESKHIFVGTSRMVTKLHRKGDDSVDYEGKNRYYYHSDHLGSAQLVTDFKGLEYERIEYTPYGELWVEKTIAGSERLPFRFTGKEFDEETGLYYYGARYLDPKVSRWLSTDPAVGEYIPSAPVNDEARRRNGNLPGMGGIYNLVNFHLYHYAGNNPVRYIDPDGRENWDFYRAWEDDEVTQSDVWDYCMLECEQQFETAVRQMPQEMEKAIIGGLTFMSEHGSEISLVCYASGHVEIGVVVDGVTLASDITLDIHEAMSKRDLKYLLVETLKKGANIMITTKTGNLFMKNISFTSKEIKAVINFMTTMQGMLIDEIYKSVDEVSK
jgi:RHS repeat-associated protein